MKTLVSELSQAGIPLEQDCPLSAYSTFRIGGPARLALFPETREQMLLSLALIERAGVPLWVIGNGSNVLFPDEGLDGAVLFTGRWHEITVEGDTLCASAGVSLAALAKRAQEESLGALAFAHGIPGTLGGAVLMNAGAYGGCMEQVVVSSSYYDRASGELRTLCGEEHGFGVRKSVYQTLPSAVILEATLRLEKGDPEEILAQMRELAAKRRSTQPLEFPSAGSVFKRPVGHYAGKLIEDCGLKGFAIGGAQVSEKHAGFIINRGGATAKDVRALVSHVQECVCREFGVELEREIRFL